MAISIIRDPVTGNQYSRDTSVAGSTFSPYTAPTPAPAPTNNDGAGDTVSNIYRNVSVPSYSDPHEDYLRRKVRDTDYNDEDVRQNILGHFQGQIDSTKGAYSQLLGEVKQQGLGRLGENTAIQARRGLIGSSFGAAQTEGTRSYNLSQEEKVLAAEASALANIKSQALGIAQQEIISKRAAKSQGSAALAEHLRTAPERKQLKLNNLALSFLSQGVAPDAMDPKQLEGIAKDYKVTTDDIVSSYLQLKETRDKEEAKQEAELMKNQSFSISEGQDRYQYNPETGKAELVASKGKTYAPSSGGSGKNFLDLTSQDKKDLLGANFVSTDIESIQGDINSHGIDAVLDDPNLTTQQKNVLQDIFGASESNQFLTKDYLKKLFGEDALKKAAKEAGVVTGGSDFIPFNERGDVETYLTELEETIQLYREAGYNDQEILEFLK